MIFEETLLQGVWMITTTPREDERGSFARTFCADEFLAYGIDHRVAQCSLSTTPQRGTLRGIHLQQAPHGETKLVQCVRGAIFDVAVDLRAGSPTFGQHISTTLSDSNRRAFLLPPGVGHGLLTLEANAAVWYQMSVPYVPGVATGVRWDDQTLNIDWPTSRPRVSKQDQQLPGLDHWVPAPD
ncbi:MAG: dTDP-4-dehydrorhamnose 3,5-epimerase family protein [Acidimicrobiales bacterium]